MKVAVLGATGATRSLVVDKLLGRGHEAIAVSRTPAPSRLDPLFSRFHGDLADPAFLGPALSGCDAVICCVGQNRASKSLFARRTSPADILRRVAAATIATIGTDRTHFFYLSAFGVGDDRRKHALAFRAILRMSAIHEAYLDHAEAEGLIRASGVAWTIVRPPGLVDGDEECALVDRGDRWSSFETVTRRSLACFLVQGVEARGPLTSTITVGVV